MDLVPQFILSNPLKDSTSLEKRINEEENYIYDDDYKGRSVWKRASYYNNSVYNTVFLGTWLLLKLFQLLDYKEESNPNRAATEEPVAIVGLVFHKEAP